MIALIDLGFVFQQRLGNRGLLRGQCEVKGKVIPFVELITTKAKLKEKKPNMIQVSILKSLGKKKFPYPKFPSSYPEYGKRLAVYF